jgi:hypothetical protein
VLAFLQDAAIRHQHYDFDVSCSLCIDSHTNARGHGQIAAMAEDLLK